MIRNVFSVKKVAKTLGVTKKEVLGMLIDKGIITSSEYPIEDAKPIGLVGELRVHKGMYDATELVITEDGFRFLINVLYNITDDEEV